MSRPKLISPMLDGFLMGDPISEHHGIRCCPAIEEATDNRYIIKIISIPASQTQLEALLLTGAYRSKTEACTYFKELCEDIHKEIGILDSLSRLEGFLPYEKMQTEPMEDGLTGFDIYLMGTYKHSLERFFRKNTMTHLAAVNMGLDLCAALAVCRQAGYLYVDLKPGNVFLTNDKGYKIGDLGFISMDSLPYSSLPEKYRSSYTPPEISDAFSELNSSMDIYALGLLMYQAYNGGTLPFEGQAIGEQLPAPLYADYEMAEIILKACAPKPEDRWETPAQMGQALIGYMQRNEVNDVPIVPPAVFSEEVIEPSPIQEVKPELLEEDILNEDPANLSFMDQLSSDETAPDEGMAEGISYTDLSNETSDILAQADLLISHETPQGVIQPEKVDVELPTAQKADPAEDPENEVPVDLLIGQAVEQIQTPEEPEKHKSIFASYDDEEYDDEDEEYYEDAPKPRKGLIALILAILVVAGLAFGGYVYYRDYYLQNVTNLQLSGDEDYLDVVVVSQIDESLLTVVCTDTYGNKFTETLTDGKARFEDLNPSTLYTVKLEIEGFHKLTGTTSKTYNTPAQSSIVTFSAVAGSEDGSVILSFTVDGQDSDKWTVRYSAEGEEERSVSFSGHMVIISGLTVGKEYTFRIDNDSDIYIVGNDTLLYNATSLVFAENLAITSCSDGVLRVEWDAPAMSNVSKWSVRCYNGSGFDQTVETEDTATVFSDLDTATAYTVEVIADGMTAGSRCYVSANSVTVTQTSVQNDDPEKMTVTWDYTGPAPTGNWLVLYTVTGSDRQEVIRTDKPSAAVSPIIPGAEYNFTIALEDGSTVFAESFRATAPEAKDFSGYTVKASNMTLIMVKAEDVDSMTVKNWQQLAQCPFATTSFQVGQQVSIPVRMSKTYATSSDVITSMFVIRDEEGNLVSANYNERTWTAMWRQYNCTLQLPELPELPGKYTVEIYFNGMFVEKLAFEVVAAE